MHGKARTLAKFADNFKGAIHLLDQQFGGHQTETSTVTGHVCGTLQTVERLEQQGQLFRPHARAFVGYGQTNIVGLNPIAQSIRAQWFQVVKT